eukprot:gnl/Carplike_NY0171/5308_a7245_320.p1 GENE.gnl/Carplike_NY0171/5308_a7245_320~~gnl/Carplike_NY0171/5308_a7245_320.p1  ORF type:complete len:461 (+),score=42.14 gnl/Carplike_NY0171/5308_a7245_320:63-1445(+)
MSLSFFERSLLYEKTKREIRRPSSGVSPSLKHQLSPHISSNIDRLSNRKLSSAVKSPTSTPIRASHAGLDPIVSPQLARRISIRGHNSHGPRSPIRSPHSPHPSQGISPISSPHSAKKVKVLLLSSRHTPVRPSRTEKRSASAIVNRRPSVHTPSFDRQSRGGKPRSSSVSSLKWNRNRSSTSSIGSLHDQSPPYGYKQRIISPYSSKSTLIDRDNGNDIKSISQSPKKPVVRGASVRHYIPRRVNDPDSHVMKPPAIEIDDSLVNQAADDASIALLSLEYAILHPPIPSQSPPFLRTAVRAQERARSVTERRKRHEEWEHTQHLLKKSTGSSYSFGKKHLEVSYDPLDTMTSTMFFSMRHGSDIRLSTGVSHVGSSSFQSQGRNRGRDEVYSGSIHQTMHPAQGFRQRSQSASTKRESYARSYKQIPREPIRQGYYTQKLNYDDEDLSDSFESCKSEEI